MTVSTLALMTGFLPFDRGYPHLHIPSSSPDVYKRQSVRRIPGSVPLLHERSDHVLYRSDFHYRTQPVSYTHLDVYKRQALSSDSLISGRSGFIAK